MVFWRFDSVPTHLMYEIHIDDEEFDTIINALALFMNASSFCSDERRIALARQLVAVFQEGQGEA